MNATKTSFQKQMVTLIKDFSCLYVVREWIISLGRAGLPQIRIITLKGTETRYVGPRLVTRKWTKKRSRKWIEKFNPISFQFDFTAFRLPERRIWTDYYMYIFCSSPNVVCWCWCRLNTRLPLHTNYNNCN